MARHWEPWVEAGEARSEKGTVGPLSSLFNFIDVVLHTDVLSGLQRFYDK